MIAVAVDLGERFEDLARLEQAVVVLVEGSKLLEGPAGAVPFGEGDLADMLAVELLEPRGQARRQVAGPRDLRAIACRLRDVQVRQRTIRTLLHLAIDAIDAAGEIGDVFVEVDPAVLVAVPAPHLV